ncbi:hypothetical protein GKZ75_08335 [Kocuria indica]|uniref:ImmA/IrrE family metallo-endopeptidase n=1 Tax=Kocuria marina subsp. indica TaxID=1049583 RepID=A0A6N9QYH8_9MICC|nr:hypothetical protein [Kocuria indica]NDO78229.1 hypothetical protein [Kocuria indica]
MKKTTEVEPQVIYRLLSGDACGYYDRANNTIVVDPRLSPRQRRITEAHERIHAERGDVCPHTEWLEIKMEAAVDRELALRLIPWTALLDAARWSSEPHEIAEELDVDEDLLEIRIAHLSDTERGRLNRVSRENAA